MPSDPPRPKVDVGQSAEERHELIEELEEWAPENKVPPARDDLTGEETYVTLQSEVLGGNALGTSPHHER